MNEESNTLDLPLLPLRDVVVYPHMVIPLFVGREKSILSLDLAMSKDKQVFLMTQKKSSKDEPSAKDIYQVGTIATILQLLKLPDGTVKVLVEGTARGEVVAYNENDPYLHAVVKVIQPQFTDSKETEILVRAVITQFEQYVKINRQIPPEILTSLAGIEDPSRLADSIAAHLTLKLEEKQKVLEIIDINPRLEKLLTLMESEIDMMQVENRIRSRVKRQMEKSQRDYYLNEQMKAIQKELGGGEEGTSEYDQLEKRIASSGMSKEAQAKAKQELSKLKMMSPMAAEATVSRNYLDWILSVPWKKRSKTKFDLAKAEKVLNDAHYGLEKVKERIIEYLAVQQRVKKLKGPVLCLVGPPGVGKTSLGQSIAESIGREFLRMSLGGVRDEAEIRGHRKTYIGSMPGKIIQKLAKVGVKNPLFMLDEIDKMAMDFRGDPASALLEVLDPEQNHTFNDHYLEVDYDLSDVMFIATANSMNIPSPLLDRMEVIRLSGYTEDEKVQIAIQHLIPKQIKANGLTENEIELTESSVRDIVRYYTREAGVRNLEREMAKVCRKVVKEQYRKDKNAKVQAEKEKIIVESKNLENYLGVHRFRFGLAEQKNQIGQVNGLAWTEVGGELLTIEAASVPGTGVATYTGHLGEVMQESIKAAMTVVRSRSQSLGITTDFYKKFDIHVHVPEGATPKDGPSAGISMCTALVSCFCKLPVRADVAMTGEITLRGEVLPIGGLKEKLLAALRAGIKRVIIPKENEKDLKEIPKNILEGLEIFPVKWIDEVWVLAFTEMPVPLGSKKASTVKKRTTPKVSLIKLAKRTKQKEKLSERLH